MTALLVLLPSPLVGPAVWTQVADRLRDDGWPVLVASSGSPKVPAEVLARFLAELPVDQELVLIPHSNAGLYVPSIACGRRVVGQVFVDASLPPVSGVASMAPPRMRELLAQLGDRHGLLPPWTEWWEAADVARLFPSEDVRAVVEESQPRLPLSYFDESLSVTAGWDAIPCGYLAFGDTYAEERERAVRDGWPVRTLDGAHLHMLVEPASVTRAITNLVAELGPSSSVRRTRTH